MQQRAHAAAGRFATPQGGYIYNALQQCKCLHIKSYEHRHQAVRKNARTYLRADIYKLHP